MNLRIYHLKTISFVFVHIDLLYHKYNILVPARGKDKKTNSSTLICDVIVMLKLCHHIVSQRIQDFLVLMFFQFKMRYVVVSKEKESIMSVRVV